MATSTECYDFLRLLYARVGRTFCPKCGVPVGRDSVDEAAGRLLALPEGSRWHALIPCGEHATTEALRDHLFELRKKGFNRLLQDGRLFEFSTPESLLDIDFSKPLFVLVDRIAMGPDCVSGGRTWRGLDPLTSFHGGRISPTMSPDEQDGKHTRRY